MLSTVALAFIAGFFAGNGLPYYVAGSTGEGTNPGPFPDSPVLNVLAGCAGLTIAAICWSAADVHAHALAGWLAALAGVASVGMIHARLWRHDPWGKHSPRSRSKEAD
jgi:hypothetical protein